MIKRQYNLKDFLEIKTSIATSFSSDGKKLSVVSNITGTFQLYLVGRNGGDLEPLTYFDDNIDFATFSPIENKIIFGMSKGGNENTQLYIYELDKNEYRKLTDKPKVKYGLGGWSRDGKYIAFSSNERNGIDFDVYTMNLESEAIKCVFQEHNWCYGAGFSPSGKYLAIGQSVSTTANNLYLIDLTNKTQELISSSEGGSSNGAPRWLPDESGFFYTSNSDKDIIGMAFYDMKTKKSHYVLENNWDIETPAITQDGEYLAISANEGGYDSLVIYETKGLKPLKSQTLPKGTSYGFGWSKDGKYLLINTSSPTSSTSSWIWSRNDNKSTKITSVQSKIPEDTFVEPELIKYKSFDELEIPAFLYLPRKIQPSEKLPVIINIHGGPEGQSRASFGSLTQYFLQAGYAVVFPNVRGSTGYGKKYLHLDDVEKRMDSVADLAALHKYLSNRDDIDGKRIALLGASYGGFMVLAGLAFYPELWAAGIDVVGISNFVTFLENTASYRRSLREEEYGSLKHDKEFLKSISPINHVNKIKSPLFVVHGKNDPRVPLVEAEQIHSKLNTLGTNVKLIVYPDEGHGISKLKNRLDLWPKVIDFLDEVVRKQA